MNHTASTVIIIGAGHGGVNAAAQLRQLGYEGRIILVEQETGEPYHRPPLSKQWLKGDMPEAQLWLRKPSFYAEQKIELIQGVTAEKLLCDQRQVVLNNGQIISYDWLILATGAKPRRLCVAGSALNGIHYLRSQGDAQALRQDLEKTSHIVIVGGGYIGLEVASTAAALGKQVTLLERSSRLLARVASKPLAEHLQQLHQAQGVTLRFSAEVASLSGTDGRITTCHLQDGDSLPCDLLVVGIGAEPADDLARQAGLDCDNGVVVDGCCRTSQASVFAIGDVSCRNHSLYGSKLRLESLPNALEQARLAACSIVQTPPPAHEVPWFWSDQFSHKVQMVGLIADARHTTVRQRTGEKSFSVFHFDEQQQLVAVEAVNAPAEFMHGKKWIQHNVRLDRSRLADHLTPLSQVPEMV